MSDMIKEAVIVAYGRSAIGKAGKGALRVENPTDTAAYVLEGVLRKVPTLRPEMIDDLIVGCARPEGVQGANTARIIGQRAKLPDCVSGQTVNRFCASGLQAIAAGANAIMAGQAEIIVAGGIESMSAVPMGGTKAENKNAWLVENRPDVYMSMGLTAENVAEKYSVTREEMDQLAVESHAKAAKAQIQGAFTKEIIAVPALDGEGNKISFANDEGVRGGTTLEKLTTLKPCFKEDGRVTAATSSQVSDGAGFVILMSRTRAEELGIRPIARFVAFAVAGVEPGLMGIGPMYAVPKVMKRAELTVTDMDVIEINEAFAAQAIPCIRELGMDVSKVNPRGGAIALGHPLGATGAILTCKALSYLEDTDGKYGLVTMCIGGGMGAAAILEMVKESTGDAGRD